MHRIGHADRHYSASLGRCFATSVVSVHLCQCSCDASEPCDAPNLSMVWVRSLMLCIAVLMLKHEMPVLMPEPGCGRCSWTWTSH